MRLVLLAVLVPAIAAAQPRDMATVCSGKPTGDDLVACGNFLLDAHNKAPSASDADQHLYNAGVMFAEARAISGAIQAFTLLGKSHPSSRLVPHALARTANLYAQVAMYDQAAEALEQYATRYAGQHDAYAALSDAIYYRRALGDDEKVIRQTRNFVRTYGTKKPAEAAAATFALTSVFEKRGDHDAAVKHLQEYLRQFGAKGGRDRLVIAHAKIGELLWKQSCLVTPIDGECLRVKRQGPSVCGGSRIIFERVKRDDRLAKEAVAAFASAIRTYEVDPRTGGDEAGARYYYARSLVARIDAEAEASPMPVARRGEKLAAWTSEQVAARGALKAKYEAVVNVKDVANAIRATLRIARLSDDLAGAIVASATKKDECEALAKTAAPFRANAVSAYAVCVMKAADFGWFDDSARSCEAALVRLEPDDVPPLRELVAAPIAATITAVSGP